MNIDFHFATTYVIARTAGFNPDEARIIAHSSQYVDDATHGGVINFDNRAIYQRISSSHKMLDYRNFKSLANHQVWIPFHFLPGNGGKKAGENPKGKFINKLVCRPNSPVAQDMVKLCVESKEKKFSLHLLGITMHVYADTWAHQGFAGCLHKVNHVENLKDHEGKKNKDMLEKISNFFGDKFDELTSKLVDDVSPLGHGAALSYPDKPYLKWSYINGLGEEIFRDNPKDFLAAADHMHQWMRKFIKGNSSTQEEGLPEGERSKLFDLFIKIQDDDENKRLHKWLQHIENGFFAFGPENVSYIHKGSNSWKHRALLNPIEMENGDEQKHIFKYHNEFMTSNWKLFHDALQFHRYNVLHLILPDYNICAA